MRAVGLLLAVAGARPLSSAGARQPWPCVAAEPAEARRAAGRPWHAAETLLAAAAREPRLNATFIVEGAKAELYARRYDRARSLLVGQPWLEDYGDGVALAVLAEAEARLGFAMQAAGHYAAARARARGSRAALLAVREGLAWEAAGARGPAAAAYGAAWLGLGRVALAQGDSSRARDALSGLMAGAPESDDAAAAVGVGLATLRPRTAPERVALARAMKGHGAASDARLEVERAMRQGDSSAATLLLAGELFAAAGRLREAERAYRSATGDPSLGALAIYRRARMLVRLGDPGASEALSGFAQSFPADTAAPTALYMLGDMLADRGNWPGAARWFGDLIARYPAHLRASLARSRLAAPALLDTP